MGKGGGSAPAAPDPAATAQAQGAVNKETAIAQAWLNNMNQNTPWGSLSYNQNGSSPDGTPRFESNINLSPEQQQILNNQNQQNIGLGNLANNYVGKIQDTFNKPFPGQGLAQMQNGIDYGSLGQTPQSADDFMNLANRTTDAMYSRLDPQFQKQESSLRTTLANQGIMPGSEAEKSAMGDFGQQKNDAYQQAIIAGQQQANTAFNQSLAGRQQGASELSSNANFMNNARQQGLNEQSYMRQMPINEYNALISGQQVQAPQFQASQGAGQMTPPNLQQLYQNQYQGQMNNYNSNQASNNNMMSGLFGLGSAIFSDIRLKTNIHKIGETPKGTNIYSYRYKGLPETHIGVLAQEIERTNPEAVVEINGFKAVRYFMVK